MPGRSHTPTNLKILRGTYRKDRAVSEEAQPVRKLPTCPPELSIGAKKEWKRISKLLFECGLLSNIDRASLASYCVNYDRWITNEMKIQEEGVLKDSLNGYPILNPRLSIARKAMDAMNKILLEFGMTPASRSRIRAQPPTEESDPLDKYRKKRG